MYTILRLLICFLFGTLFYSMGYGITHIEYWFGTVLFFSYALIFELD